MSAVALSWAKSFFTGVSLEEGQIHKYSNVLRKLDEEFGVLELAGERNPGGRGFFLAATDTSRSIYLEIQSEPDLDYGYDTEVRVLSQPGSDWASRIVNSLSELGWILEEAEGQIVLPPWGPTGSGPEHS